MLAYDVISEMHDFTKRATQDSEEVERWRKDMRREMHTEPPERTFNILVGTGWSNHAARAKIMYVWMFRLPSPILF